MYPCFFSSNPHRNWITLYCIRSASEVILVPSLKMVFVRSPPFLDLTVVIKKSMVLYSGGFHLKESSHVTFRGWDTSPIFVQPTPYSSGVKINPSVSYSYKPFSMSDNKELHAAKMASFSIPLLNFLHSILSGGACFPSCEDTNCTDFIRFCNIGNLKLLATCLDSKGINALFRKDFFEI